MFEKKLICPAFGTDYVQFVAKRIHEHGKKNPLGVKDVVVFVPTQRIAARLSDLLAALETTHVMPTIYTLGAITFDDVLELTGIQQNPQTLLSARAVQLHLAQIIMHENRDTFRVNLSQAIHLAEDLTGLLATLTYHDRGIADLENVVADEFASHWQITIGFLKQIYQAWLQYCDDHNVCDSAVYHAQAVKALIRAWHHTPTARTVIALGSSGSLPLTMDLLVAISRLENGYIVAPLGSDRLVKSQDELQGTNPLRPENPTHPLAPADRLIETIADRTHGNVVCIARGSPPVTARINKTLAFLSSQTSVAECPSQTATHDDMLEAIVADDQEQEAQVIACIVRTTLETKNKTLMLITHNRQLARRVGALLMRWGIHVGDSAGQPLSTTHGGGATLEVLNALCNHKEPLSLSLYLLQQYKELSEQDAHAYRTCEQMLRRKQCKETPPWPPEVTTFANELLRVRNRLQSGLHHIADLVAAHKGLCTSVFTPSHHVGKMWDLLSETGGVTPRHSLADYETLFQALMHSETARTNDHHVHPRVQILGPLEARGMRADVVILGSLVQGDWPRSIPSDPWMSRAMRRDVGLSPLEQRMGLSCHDFLSALSNDHVYLTRSLRVNGREQIPTSWWTRCAAFFSTHDQTQKWTSLARHVCDKMIMPLVWERPAPVPELALRPKRFSASDVGRLVVDPYSIFAKQVLNVRPLNPREIFPDAALRGTVLHRVFELAMQYFQTTRVVPTIDVLCIWLEQACTEERVESNYRYAWLPRFHVIFEWFIKHLTAHPPAQTFCEVWGEWIMPDGYTIFAKADRIDVDSHGGLHVIDYKTGGVPTRKNVMLGFAPQLLVEGVIAKHNGFEGVPAGRVRSLQYWSLTGGQTNGQITCFDTDIADILETAEEGMKVLFQHYGCPEASYPACPHEVHAPPYNDYEVLARRSEWLA